MGVRTLKFANIKVGGEYVFCLSYEKDKIYSKMKKIKVLDILNRKPNNPLVKVFNITDNKYEEYDITHLQPHPDIIKRKYQRLYKYYKKHNKKLIILKGTLYEQKEDYIIVGHNYYSNQVIYITKEGIMKECHISNINWIKFKINNQREYWINRVLDFDGDVLD